MKQYGKTKAILLATTLIAAGVLSGCSKEGNPDSVKSDYTLHYTTYHNSTADQQKTVQKWAKEVESLTDGGVKVEFHYSQSLSKADEAVESTLDGRADLAHVASIYATSTLPMYTVSELPFETQNPEAQVVALDRLYKENEVYRKDFEDTGVKLLYTLPLGIVVMGLKEPAESPAELSGRSIRSGGLVSEVLMAAGVNPVSMTSTDIYESMERGVVKGYSAMTLSTLSPFGLTRVTPYVVDPGIGAYAGTIVVMNSDLFDSMPDDYKTAIEEASLNVVRTGLEELDIAGKNACKELKEAGAKFSRFSDDDISSWKQSINVASEWVDRYEKQGYDAQLVLDDYRKFIAEEESKSTYSNGMKKCMEK